MAEILKPSDEQLQELFADFEDNINEKAIFAPLISSVGGNLYNVQLDVECNDDGTWTFVTRLICENVVTVPESGLSAVKDKMEEIGDEIYHQFEKLSLDPQVMGDYKVEVTAE